jgi:ABC-type lipoprotein export system ATPase subunit
MIVGRSGCGKTTVLYNLITQECGIPFHFLHLFSKSIDQVAYKELKRAFDKLRG